MTYNLSFMDNSTGILGIAEGVNDASGGWLFGLLLAFLYILFLMVFSDYDMKNVLVADSFIVSILAGVLFGAGLVSAWVLTFPIVLLVITLVIKIWGDS